jgi:hypothetical protein
MVGATGRSWNFFLATPVAAVAIIVALAAAVDPGWSMLLATQYAMLGLSI